MRRFETRVEDGVYEIEGQDGWLEIGPFEDIVAELGEVYEIEYDEKQAAMSWLDTDDGILRIDVRERLPELSFDEEFVGLIADTPLDQRLGVFTDLIDRIWESKGNLEDY